MNQAVRNANDAISLAQTAEGAISEITTSLQRIRQLSIQSQNGINSSADRLALQKEVSALRTEISRIATDTQFGNVNILDGNFSASFLVSVETASGAAALLSAVDAAISGVGGVRADLGALQNRFQSTIRNLSNISENLSAARSQIRDTDFAAETAELTRNQIIQQASVSVLSQANQRPQTALSLLG